MAIIPIESRKDFGNIEDGNIIEFIVKSYYNKDGEYDSDNEEEIERPFKAIVTRVEYDYGQCADDLGPYFVRSMTIASISDKPQYIASDVFEPLDAIYIEFQYYISNTCNFGYALPLSKHDLQTGLFDHFNILPPEPYKSDRHRCYPKKFRKGIRQVMLMNKFESNLFKKIPKDILYVIFTFYVGVNYDKPGKANGKKKKTS